MPGSKPTHYNFRVNRSVEVLGIMFKPDADYTATAAIHDKLKEVAADAIVSATPVIME